MQISQAKQILKEYDLPSNIVEHVTKVAQICQFLAKHIPKIDLNVLICAALLHDLFKLTKGDHSKDIFDFLNKLNEPKMALIAYKHDFSAIIDPQKLPFTLEEKILNYADKRVRHDKIVTLKERFDDFKQRYNPNEKDPKWAINAQKAYYDLEKELFESLNITPEDIKEENLKDL